VVFLIIGHFGYTVCQETYNCIKHEATVLRCMKHEIKLDEIHGFSQQG